MSSKSFLLPFKDVRYDLSPRAFRLIPTQEGYFVPLYLSTFDQNHHTYVMLCRAVSYENLCYILSDEYSGFATKTILSQSRVHIWDNSSRKR